MALTSNALLVSKAPIDGKEETSSTSDKLKTYSVA
jgi:hypothetical protein